MAAFEEQRRHPRRRALSAMMVTPNGDKHEAQLIDLSAGGARVRLPSDWRPQDGAALRMFFEFGGDDAITLHGRVARVAVDHMGVAFDPDQDADVEQLFAAVERHG
jgi:hypothetical protein